MNSTLGSVVLLAMFHFRFLINFSVVLYGCIFGGGAQMRMLQLPRGTSVPHSAGQLQPLVFFLQSFTVDKRE